MSACISIRNLKAINVKNILEMQCVSEKMAPQYLKLKSVWQVGHIKLKRYLQILKLIERWMQFLMYCK
jgi:hypothetical protein